MLKQLFIKNIAIIESLSLDFQKGLTVITGESGSGKSILLDAIALAFGAKASPREILRTGAERGQVELLFDLGKLSECDLVQSFLVEHGITLLPDETELLLSREFTGGGSRSRLNGTPVTRDVLEQLRPWIIDLHGQHELTSLFHKDRQRDYLDALGGEDIARLKQSVAQSYDAWHHTKQQITRIEQNHARLLQEKDFLAFQLNELLEAQLEAPDEDAQMKQDLTMLSHADKLIQVALQGNALLSEGDAQAPAVLDQLGKLEKKLNDVSAYDQALAPLLERFNGAYAELMDLSAELSRYVERVDANPERMSELTERLDLLEKLKRKHGLTLTALIEKRDALSVELAQLEQGEENLDELRAALEKQELQLKAACVELTSARQALAETLKVRLTEQLQVLAMPSVLFDIQFSASAYSREGADSLEFLFSANPGEPLRSLAKVASGGELSRVLLALKVLTAENDGLLTLVFDEIDTGISGPTAKAVAEKLAELSRHLQVLTITHQPMVAAMGQQHWHVEKQTLMLADGLETTQVRVTALEENEEQRLTILSRLVSGLESSDDAAKTFISRLREQAIAFHNQPLLKA